jgi:uncharacterized protein YlxW (UPF0749 family)
MTAQQPRSAWSTVVRMGRPRATRANLFAAVLAVVLGFALATQVQETQEQGLEDLREEELVRILDDVTQDAQRLADDARELEATRDRLLSGAGSNAEALRAAQERLDALAILAGTAPATGPGIVVRISDPEGRVGATLLIDAVQELRDAGAEAIQIGDVRVVASTYFSDGPDGVSVSGVPLEQPYTIRAIGGSATMASAMDIPGGVSESVRRVGATATVSQEESVAITALHTLQERRYARPVPNPTGTG